MPIDLTGIIFYDTLTYTYVISIFSRQGNLMPHKNGRKARVNFLAEQEIVESLKDWATEEGIDLSKLVRLICKAAIQKRREGQHERIISPVALP